MSSRAMIATLLLLLPGNGYALSPPVPAPPADLAAILEPLRASGKLPALAAAVVRDGQLVAIGAVGVRRLGSPTPVSVHDRFHLGSDTKAMTATLAAIMVEQGRLGWQTTVGEVFPDEKRLAPACRAITLEELLTHRAGLPHDSRSEQPYFDPAWQEHTPPVEQRLYLLRDVLSQPPETPPGEKYAYSNVDYAIAGAMLEKLAGQPWETLMRQRLFEPLGMASAGFGSPGRLGENAGHRMDGAGKLVAVPPGPGDDNPAAIGPAGSVHCNLEDWAKFALLHLLGSHGDTALLKKAGFDKLHTAPPGQDYAMGWLAVTRPWAGGVLLTHAGSNTMNFAVIWLVPEKNFAVLVATNCYDEQAEKTCDKVVVTLLRQAGLLPASPAR